MKTLLRLASLIEAMVFYVPTNLIVLLLTTALTGLLVAYRFVSRGYYRALFHRNGREAPAPLGLGLKGVRPGNLVDRLNR